MADHSGGPGRVGSGTFPAETRRGAYGDPGEARICFRRVLASGQGLPRCCRSYGAYGRNIYTTMNTYMFSPAQAQDTHELRYKKFVPKNRPDTRPFQISVRSPWLYKLEDSVFPVSG